MRRTFRAGEVMHAQVEPDHEVFLGQRFAVEEFGEVLLRLPWQVDVLEAVAIWLIVVLAGDGQVMLRKLPVLPRERRVERSQPNIRSAGQDTIATLLAPDILVILVENNIHGAIVTSPVERALSLKILDVELHLFELTELRKPWLGLIDDHEIADLERVCSPENVEVCLEIEYVVVERALSGGL